MKRTTMNANVFAFIMGSVAFIAWSGAATASDATTDVASLFRPIEFTSRAQCSISSASPARSIMIVGDGYDAGRLAYNLKTKSGVAVSEIETLTAYRKAVGFTFKLVIEKMLSGKLPLLSGPAADPALRPLLESCLSQGEPGQRGCRVLESKLETLWTFALAAPDNSKTGISPRVGCHKIASFSALHGHLNRTSPTMKDLEVIGAMMSEAGQSPATCDGESNQSDRHFLLQLDLLSLDEKLFEKQGFDFWTSAKTYAAWAWRKSPEVQFQMGRFGSLFPNLALEEEVLLVPNGCRSISLPRCELQRLSLDSLRELAKPPGNESGFERNAPNGPQDDLVARGTRGVNNGFLGTTASDTAAWVKNFTTRFNEARWASRNKLQGALRQSRLLEKLSNETLVRDIESDLSKFKATENVSLASQMAAVCLEAKLLQDPNLKILRPNFEAVIAAGGDLTPELTASRGSLQQVASSSQDLAKRLLPLCESLEKSLFKSTRTETRSFNWNYLSDWARERIGPLPTADGPAMDATEKRRGWARPDAYLLLKSPAAVAGTSATEIEICRSPLACAQMSFKSYLDLYYVSTWAAALQNARRLKDSNLFNPYAELTACKIYDPWYTTEQANADLTQRLVVSVLAAPLPIPVFFESTEKRPKTVAMKGQLTATPNGGKELRFDPKYADEESRKMFFTDLGPLTGAPCGIQYATETGVPFQVYGFSGITLNFCSDGKDAVSDTHDDGTTSGKAAQRSICGGCSVNATAAVSIASYAAAPGVPRLIFGAMRAFSLYNTASKDDVNRPIMYTVNPAYVADAYRENGKVIPEGCKDSLISGFRCYNDPCAANAAKEFEDRSGIRVTDSSIQYEGDESLGNTGTRSGMVGLRVPQCDSEIIARVRCDARKRSYELLGEFSAFSKSCKSLIQKVNAVGR